MRRVGSSNGKHRANEANNGSRIPLWISHAALGRVRHRHCGVCRRIDPRMAQGMKPQRRHEMALAAESFSRKYRQVRRLPSSRPWHSPKAVTITGHLCDHQGIAAILEIGAAGKNTCHSSAANRNKSIYPSDDRIVFRIRRAAIEEWGRHRDLFPSRSPKSRSYDRCLQEYAP